MQTAYCNLYQLAIICLSITACSTSPVVKTDLSLQSIIPAEYHQEKKPHYYFKDDLFLSSEKPTQYSDADILALNNEIKHFLDKNIRPIKNSTKRLKALRKAVFSNDGLNIRYSSYPTQTAVEAYHSKAVNCISFANLFIAMGRYVNLPLQYQYVEIPPYWDKKNDNWILSQHVNVHNKLKRKRVANHYTQILYGNIYSSGPSYASYYAPRVIDISPAYIDKYKSRRISDEEAFALYYNNLGAEALVNNKVNQAYWLLKKSILTYPKTSSAWANLGSLYKRKNQYKLAEQAYYQAISINPNESAAYNNLIGLYKLQGHQRKARNLFNKTRIFRSKNPYYHYMLAQKAFNKQLYQAVIKHLNKAIQIKHNEHEFYYLLAKTNAKLGKYTDVTNNLIQAKIYANDYDKKKYLYKLQKVRSSIKDLTTQ